MSACFFFLALLWLFRVDVQSRETKDNVVTNAICSNCKRSYLLRFEDNDESHPEKVVLTYKVKKQLCILSVMSLRIESLLLLSRWRRWEFLTISPFLIPIERAPIQFD